MTWQLDPKALGSHKRHLPVPSMWRVPLAIVTVAVLVALFVLAGARAAAATTIAQFHLAAWKVESLADVWAAPQLLEADVLLDVASLDVLDLVLPPGCYQLDLYLNDEITDALLAGRVLYGPSNPQEHLAYGALGEGVSPWKYLCIDAPVPTETPTVEPTETPTPEPTESSTPTPEPTISATSGCTTGCGAAHLAEAGDESFTWLLGAFAALLLGVLALLLPMFRRELAAIRAEREVIPAPRIVPFTSYPAQYHRTPPEGDVWAHVSDKDD